MKFFLDSANTDEMRAAAVLGVVRGATASPTLIAREGRSAAELIEELASLVDGPLCVPAVSQTPEEMVSQALRLTEIHKNIVASVPLCAQGLQAIHELSVQGIRTSASLVFSAAQALLAARAGAAFVCPCAGRLDDAGGGGGQLVSDIADIFKLHGIKTEIISSSIRQPHQVAQAAKAGAHIAAVPYPVLMKLLDHPLTHAGMEAYARDWERIQTL